MSRLHSARSRSTAAASTAALAGAAPADATSTSAGPPAAGPPAAGSAASAGPAVARNSVATVTLGTSTLPAGGAAFVDAVPRTAVGNRQPQAARVEQKFFISPFETSTVYAWLRRSCRVDTEYPVDQVNSLYFDTSDLDQHERSLSGEYSKDKVRIRWYGEECDPHRTSRNGPASERGAGMGTIPVWLELKSRRGFASTKQRLQLDVAAEALSYDALSRGIVAPSLLMATMAYFGFFPKDVLRPVIVISYKRRRFVDPWTGLRVSLDSHIRSSMVMPGLGYGERALELPGAVVEVKGLRFYVPPSLRLITEVGSSWTRYSKYSSCLEGHEAVRGSLSRLWPSGVLGNGWMSRLGS